MRKILLSVAMGALVLATSAKADERAERLKIAHEYVQLSVQDMGLDAVIEQMWKPVVDQIEASGTKLNDSQLQRISKLYDETFAGPLKDLMLKQDEIMADILTLEEITALRDFYKTDAGRSVMQKFPQIMARQQPLVIELVQTKLPGLLPKIQEIVSQP